MLNFLPAFLMMLLQGSWAPEALPSEADRYARVAQLQRQFTIAWVADLVRETPVAERTSTPLGSPTQAASGTRSHKTEFVTLALFKRETLQDRAGPLA